MEKNCNSDPWWKNDKCWCKRKKCHACAKDYVWNHSTCNCEDGKYLASILDNSVIVCDEVIESYYEETKIVPTNFNKKI